MLLAMSTVAVNAPENGMPVPGVERMPGLTTTMYAIVKNVVTPPTTSAYRLRSHGARIRVIERFRAWYHPPSLTRSSNELRRTGPHSLTRSSKEVANELHASCDRDAVGVCASVDSVCHARHDSARAGIGGSASGGRAGRDGRGDPEAGRRAREREGRESRRVDLLERHGQRLSGGDLEDPQGHGE